VPELLDHYQVGYAVSSPAIGSTREETLALNAAQASFLRANGFVRVVKGVNFSLWKREAAAAPPDAKAPTGSPAGRDRQR
jgi:hypothetical protein